MIANFNATNQEYFNWDYDIALLKLNSSATKEVEIVKLPSHSFEVSETGSMNCKAAGKSLSFCYRSMGVKAIRSVLLRAEFLPEGIEFML